jgi:light-regulated signal transduction histidine kinase (bacteriophytochrome)/HAMP domain-containing protein
MAVSIRLGLAVMMVVLLVAYLLSQFLQRQISRPVLSLAEAASAVSERGDFSVRATKFGRDELGLLTDAFNQMLARIQAQNRELNESSERVRRLNDELEHRVAERTAQFQAANSELEAFSYSVSHDLRAPLRHIDGFAAMLAKHAAAGLDDKGRRYIATISESARRMGRLIDDLLVFSRMNRSTMNKSEIDHDALVAGVLRDGHHDKNGPITWEIAPLPRVRADPAMLRQVWFNLIDNAAKYSAKTPRPRIAIGSLPGTNGELTFFVRDNGVGFDMDHVDKLYGVFQRLHGLTEFEGTGIGLANVRRIITRHGGRTWAEGRVGEGATFYFALPAPIPPKPV